MKKSILLILSLVMVLALVACGDKEKDNNDKGGSDTKQEKTLDAAALINDLKTNITYEATLEEVAKDDISNFIELEADVQATLYMGSTSSTAEEIGVFVCKDKATADKMLANVKAFLTDQSESFKYYIPKESERIDNGVVEMKGNVVIMCISGDSNKAKEIIGKY